jgi:hypothetical protein
MQYICSTSGGREHGQRKREGGTSGDDGRNETLPTKHISIRRKGRRMTTEIRGYVRGNMLDGGGKNARSIHLMEEVS